MKPWNQICIAALFLLVSAPAALAAIEVEGSAYVGVYDKYLWRGFNLSGSETVVQPGADLSAKGFTLSWWGNLNTRTGEMDEVDVTIDYTAELNELVSLSVGNIFYALDGLADTNELYAGVALNTLLSPALTIYYDYDEAESDGLFFIASIGHSLDLVEGLSLDLGALVSYNQASDYAVGSYRDWHNYQLSVGLTYALTDQITINPSFAYSSPISNAAKEAIDSEVLGGVNLSLSF